MPDLDVTDVDLEICAIRVHRVGSGLPCIFHSNPNSRVNYTKSVATRKFDDSGSLRPGAACPVNYPNGGASANQFTASMFWRLPQKQQSSSLELFLGGGMSVGSKIVWPLAEEYDIVGTLEEETLGIVANDFVVDPSKIS